MMNYYSTLGMTIPISQYHLYLIDFGLIDHVRSPWLEVDINPVYSFDGIVYKENLDEID